MCVCVCVSVYTYDRERDLNTLSLNMYMCTMTCRRDGGEADREELETKRQMEQMNSTVPDLVRSCTLLDELGSDN